MVRQRGESGKVRTEHVTLDEAVERHERNCVEMPWFSFVVFFFVVVVVGFFFFLFFNLQFICFGEGGHKKGTLEACRREARNLIPLGSCTFFIQPLCGFK